MGQGSLPNIEFSQTLGYKWPCTQSSLLVVFVCKAKICAQLFDQHAQGLANTASVLSRDSSDSLRGNDTAAAFLQQARTSPSVAAMDTHTPAQCRLPSLGSHFGPPLRDHGGPATHQQNRHLAIQRNLPFLAWPSSFSRSVHVAPLPEAGASQGHSSTGGPPRPLANQVVFTWCIGSRGSACPRSISTPRWIPFVRTSWSCRPNSPTKGARTSWCCPTTIIIRNSSEPH